MRIARRSLPAPELQIAAFVDVLFLLLVFFMVQPLSRPEGELALELPGTAAQEAPVPLPDAQRIVLRAGGEVLLNELPVGAPSDRELPRLAAILARFRAACAADGIPARVILVPDDAAVHQRIADVLAACARAGVSGVTLAGPDGAP
ncbi:MAG: biopolymer transporter ExbD [Verrucomicrobium sp.]|nr:biopolymer transporter ExbD [Verrucomicrobium sp.]